MHIDSIFRLSDSMTDLRVEIEGIRCFVDLLLSAYAEPSAEKIARTASVASVDRLQHNLFTLFDLIMKALDDAKKAESLADAIFESSKSPA